MHHPGQEADRGYFSHHLLFCSFTNLKLLQKTQLTNYRMFPITILKQGNDDHIT